MKKKSSPKSAAKPATAAAPKARASDKRRIAPRKEVAPIHVSSFTSLSNFAKISHKAELIQASSSGFLLLVKREDLIPSSLRGNLTIDALIGDRVFIRLQDMNLEVSGVITRTKLLGKQGFNVAIDYSDEAPEYWRECLMDLLPQPGEIKDDE